MKLINLITHAHGVPHLPDLSIGGLDDNAVETIHTPELNTDRCKFKS